MNLKNTIFFFLLLSLAACMKIPEPTSGNTQVGDDEVPEGFDFGMSYQQEVAIQAIDENGEPMYRVRFYLFSSPPEQGGKVVATGLTDEEGYYRTSVQVTTHQVALYAYTPYLDLVRAQRLELNGEKIEHSWGVDPFPLAGASYKTAIDTTFGCDPSFYQVIGNYLKKLDVVSGTYMTLGPASSNYNGIGYNVEDGMIYGFKNRGSSMDLWRLNPIGQETNLGSITSPSSFYAGGHFKGDFDLEGNLYSVNGTRLGWVDVDSFPLTGYEKILSNPDNASMAVHDIAYNDKFDKFYTVDQYGNILTIDHQAGIVRNLGNFSSSIGNPSAFGAVWCISSGEVFFSQNATGNVYRADLDASGNPTKVELQLVGESTSNNDGAGCVEAESPFNDIDGDGIPNGNDDYPEDGEVAYATYTPDQISYGSYAFEDFWPKRGDYDFNDVVMGYNYEAARDTNNNIHWLTMNFKLRALGAGFKTGFGIQLDGVTPSQIASVTGPTTTTTSVAANGCENGQTQAVIMVTDNAHANFGVPVGHFVNTGADGTAAKDPVDIVVKITFTSPIASVGRVNPFITTRGDRGYEIHLMGYSPTDLVNSALFDTEGDVSGDGTYYVDTYGYPWGMHFPAPWDFPKEKVEIRTSYPQFKTWVRSAGVEQTDWYGRTKANLDKVIIR